MDHLGLKRHARWPLPSADLGDPQVVAFVVGALIQLGYFDVEHLADDLVRMWDVEDLKDSLPKWLAERKARIRERNGHQPQGPQKERT